MLNAENELKKWAPVLEHADAPAITDSYKKAVTAKLLENTEHAIRQESAAQSFSLNETKTGTGSVQNFDPVLISLVRRAMPNLIAYDVAGVQPMSGPTGLIFAMKPRLHANSNYINSPGGTAADVGTEAFLTEPDTDFSGTGSGHSSAASDDTLFNSPISSGTGQATKDGETDSTLPEMGFTIEKQTVTAVTRQLKAEYSMELAQDLKAIHGLDAESELANILSGEILGEINREVIRKIVNSGVRGGAPAGGTAGTFNLVTDADGRWAVEKFQSLIFQIEREANAIAQSTRRGKGNFVICSSDVASALAAAGKLTFGGEGELNVDALGNTFAGTLNGRLKVYVDPYASQDYVTVGYKGTNPYDAGIFYAPYVPLTMVRAVGENSFQPKIAFKTRYGLTHNPLASGLGKGQNNFFRTFKVDNLNVGLQS